MFPKLTCRIFLLARLAVLVAAATPPAYAQLGSYTELDRVEGPWVDFNTASIRPMVLVGNTLYAINTHDSTLRMFQGSTTGGPWSLPWGPVAIARWDHGSPNVTELVVLCRNSSCLVRLDTSGNVLGMVPLIACTTNTVHDGSASTESGGPVGAGDLIVDAARGKAIVSCTWIDAVMEVDLGSDAVTGRWDESVNPVFRMKGPQFLSLVEHTSSTGPEFYVAPLFSGNNTTVMRGAYNPGLIYPFVEGPNTGTTLVNLDSDPTADQLPDEDLFVIDPTVAPSATGAVTAAARRVGTTLFAHRKNPSTGSYWMLNTEALNAVDGKQSEPAVRGEFVENRVTILTDLGTVTPSDGENSTANSIKPLDKLGSNQDISVGQPYSILFHKLSSGSHYGKAYVCGLLSDKIVRLDSSGNYDAVLQLPAGSGYIPRALLMNGTETILLVYCWGTNEVLAYHVSQFAGTLPSAPVTPFATYDLGHDPAPQSVQDGRAIFYDGRRSADGNASCASCHVEGRTDLLTWNLSNQASGTAANPIEPGFDNKGPMATQTLAGLERMTPFHWRGERNLDDFNGAFTALLGASQDLNSTELAAFKAFVFAIQSPANPAEHRDRKLSADIDLGTPPGFSSTTSAVNGQSVFRNNLTFGQDNGTFNHNFRCNDCHAAPTGTINDIHADFDTLSTPRRTDFKPTPFSEPWVKMQSRLTLPMGDALHQVYRSFLGTGLSHSGLIPDVLGFVQQIGINGTTNDIADLVSFILQWDQGLAPAAHFSFLLTSSSANATWANSTSWESYIETQRTARNCDLVVLGKSMLSGTMTDTRWYWDRSVSPALFRSQENATRADLAAFKTGALNDGEINLVLGVPVGMGRRFAVDYDMDGILNVADGSQAYTPNNPSSDTQVPTFQRGPALVWNSTRVARFAWQVSEPSTVDFEYRPVGSSSATSVSVPLSDSYSLVLTDLRPSTRTGDNHTTPLYNAENVQYEWRAMPTDKSGNQGSWTSWATFQTKSFIEPEYLGSTNFQPNLKGRILGQHIVRSLSQPTLTSTGGTGSGTADFHVDVEVGLKRGAAPGTLDAPNRVVIGRMFVRRSSTTATDFRLASVSSVGVTKSGTTESAGNSVGMLLPGTGTTTLSTGPGVYLLSAPTASSGGTTSVDCHLSGLQTGDEIVFNLDAVIEYTGTNFSADVAAGTDTSGNLSLSTPFKGSYSQWDFPTTKEARSKTLPVTY